MPASEVFRTPDDRFSELPEFPYPPRYLEFGDLRMHYVDEGQGTPCLLLHGEPTWSFLYRKVVPGLLETGLRCIAPDLIGFGRSDKWTRVSRYSYQGHVDSIRHLVTSLDLKDVTLVVHDWSGPIGLRMATLESQRIARWVVLNTGLFDGSRPLSGMLRRWRSFVASKPDFEVGEAVARGCVSNLTPEVRAAYNAPFPHRSAKAGARAFPLLIPEAEHDPGARQMRETAQRLALLARPALVLWGDRDPIFPVHQGWSLAQRFAGAGFHILEGAGHFVPEDAGPQLAAAIAQFVRHRP